jgi:hypothetical protein
LTVVVKRVRRSRKSWPISGSSAAAASATADVLRDVAGRVSPHEREVRPCLQSDGAGEHVAQRSVGSTVFAERKFHQGTRGEGLAEQREERSRGQ